ncbi:CD225/dispanin family protein [Tessaracoccus lubricantis]|uniref:CD225/dispanin family protein n=1 Tax=Tessaracoccus lubricantis TaxID=545543 RepID=A0ABP9FF35_9ACTN
MSQQDYQGPQGQPDPQQNPYGQAPDYGQTPAAPYGQPSPYGEPAQQPYGQPAYGYGAPKQEHPQAQTVLILGIVGIFFSICAFIAWYMGGKAKKEIEAGAPYSFDGNLKVGYLLGKIISILAIVGAVLAIVFIIFAGVLAASAGY